MKDLLIGAVDLYDWSKIKVWATSARQSGFTGDIVLLTYRVHDDVVLNAQKLGIDVYQIEHDAFGRAISHEVQGRNTQVHQLRFFHMWQFLSTDDVYKKYRCVITTDVRDVWFQKNPSCWLDQQINNGYLFSPQDCENTMVSSSEGLLYKNEPWGADNMINGFGPLVWEIAQNWTIYNVGVVAGVSRSMMGLFLTLYNMTVGRYIPSDQSAYNMLTNLTMPYKFFKTNHNYDWTCQCGTSLDPNKLHLWDNSLEHRPEWKNNQVVNYENTAYTVVHQYDRVPEINFYVENLYA